MKDLIISTLIFLAILLLLAGTVWADYKGLPIWKGLLREAGDQGSRGQYAVACVVRNRLNAGMDHGLTGLRKRDLNRFVRQEGKQAEIMAKRIEYLVFVKKTKDITGGATHYDNIQKYGRPSWSKGMIKTCKIGCHTFYKSK